MKLFECIGEVFLFRWLLGPGEEEWAAGDKITLLNEITTVLIHNDVDAPRCIPTIS